MKKNEVEVGKFYTAKITGHMATVRIDAENPQGGWTATNITTGKKIKIKSAQRLRRETRAPGNRKKIDSLAESDAKMAREQAIAERAAQQVRKDIARTVEAVQDGDLTKGITVPTRAKKIKKATNTAKVPSKRLAGEESQILEWPGCSSDNPGRRHRTVEHQGNGRPNAGKRHLEQQRQDAGCDHLCRYHPRNLYEGRRRPIPQG